MPEYLPPGTFLYGVVEVDADGKPVKPGPLPSPEEMRAMLLGPPCPDCEKPLRAGLLSNDLNITGVSMTEEGIAVEGYHRPKKMWWCLDCAGVCIEDVLDEDLWDAVRENQEGAKVELNCPNCNVTLDIYPVEVVYCPCCEHVFNRETRQPATLGGGDESSSSEM